LQAELGSAYVNDFNLFGRTYQVRIQADAQYRSRPDDILRHYVRNGQGEMVPLRTLVTLSSTLAPETIRRFNMLRAAQVNGEPAPGASSGEAIAAMERTAGAVLPRGMGFEWSGASLQELKAGQKAPVLFALAVLFAYLFLVAQYESWSVPLAVILCVPLAALGAVAGLLTAGIAGDLFAQIGMVLLIGLAAKNAILIVEFATVKEEAGALPAAAAAVTAGTLRFRAILMTALTFILGVLPLLIAQGAGAASRQSLGTTVFSGMVAATAVGTLFVPVFYVAIRRLTAPRGADVMAATDPYNQNG
jgi:multidrug efflux pump subunit AcrB